MINAPANGELAIGIINKFLEQYSTKISYPDIKLIIEDLHFG